MKKEELFEVISNTGTKQALFTFQYACLTACIHLEQRSETAFLDTWMQSIDPNKPRYASHSEDI
jgi:hypothetical protein